MSINPVAYGDSIAFPLVGKNGKPHPVHKISWSQLGMTRQQEYYAIPARVIKDNSTQMIALFVQKDMFDGQLDQFAEVEETDKGKIGKAKINEKFQYGQKDADGTKRFVVYHDQNNKPFQHRFLHTSIALVEGEQALGVLNNMGMSANGSLDAVETIMRNFIGDALHTFQP